MSEINGINPNQISAIEPTQDQTEGVAKVSSHDAPAKDSINLSAEAESLQQIEQNIKTMPAIDMDRVTAIRNAIELGEYQVNSSQLANKIIDFEESFLVTEE